MEWRITIVTLVMAGLLLWLERVHARLARKQIDSGPELLARVGW
jgi:hypothetical protein